MSKTGNLHIEQSGILTKIIKTKTETHSLAPLEKNSPQANVSLRQLVEFN